MPPRITRFAPSPTGLLHLGHAFSALTAHDIASPGNFLLRMEDIDEARSRPAYESAIFRDLAWLGLTWPEPVLRQSEHRPRYAAALAQLTALGVTYPCRCTRAEIRAALAAPQEGAAAPAGYPGTCRGRTMAEAGPNDAVRLDLGRAMTLAGDLRFDEVGPIHAGRHRADPAALGDVVLARRDVGTAYHLAVVVDDARQNVTHVVRGVDLWEATPLHRLLQALLGLPVPVWHHHALVRDSAGRRLAKRDDARAIARYREDGMRPEDVAALARAGVR